MVWQGFISEPIYRLFMLKELNLHASMIALYSKHFTLTIILTKNMISSNPIFWIEDLTH